MGEERALPIIIPRLDRPEETTAEERDDALLLLEAARTELDIQRTKILAVSDEHADYRLFGYTSTVAYLKARARISGGRAKRYLSLARSARRLKATFQSWRHRQITSDEAELLFQTAEKMPDKYTEAEPVLLEIVGDGYDETRKTLRYWRQAADRAGVEIDEKTQHLRRRFDISRKSNGMVEGDFALSQIAGETLIVALDALMPPPADHDARTTPQRRADAVEDLARAYLEGTETPEVGGEKPHLNIHVDMNALEERPGGLHETEGGSVLTVASVRQLACDASLSRIVWNAESEIIDVGRKTRTIPAATRRAVIARDRHCVYPGCDRSPRWADMHHVDHWADGGRTNLGNLCLLCRHHHTLVHNDSFAELLLAETMSESHTRPT